MNVVKFYVENTTLKAIYSRENSRELRLSGNDVISLVKRYCNKKLNNYYEGTDDLILRFDDSYISIMNYKDVFKNRSMVSLFEPVLRQALDIEQKRNLEKVKKKKVQRKNKYAYGAKIVLASVLALLAGISAVNAFHGTKESYSLDINPAIEVQEEYINLDNYDFNDISIVKEDPIVLLNFEDRSLSLKAQNARNKYGELINKYSKMYGLDPKLVSAIAIQERGEHSTVRDAGGATGLMQIENSAWVGGELSAYNFETNSWENIIIKEWMLSDLETNVKLACMIIQTNLNYYDYNILKSIQGYNFGYGNMQTVLNNYCMDCGKTKDEVLSDQYDTKWTEYRNLVDVGDSEYLEHVLSYCGSDFNLEVKKPDGTPITLNIANKDLSKTR